MSDAIEQIARQQAALTKTVSGLTHARQVTRSTITTPDGDVPLVDALTDATEAAAALPGQREDLASLDAAQSIDFDLIGEVFIEQEAISEAAQQARLRALESLEELDGLRAEVEAAREELNEKLTTANELIAAMDPVIADVERRANEAFGAATDAGTVAADAVTQAAAAQTAADAAGDAAQKAQSDAVTLSQAAEEAAKAEAVAKADAARLAAIAAASTDAQAKADAAKAQAKADAAADATTKANAARDTATAVANAAQTTADQAKTAAATAQSAAGSAQSTANSALTMAGTKGKVYYSTAAPSGTGTAQGDLWRQVDASKNVTAEWYWTGTAWQASQITTTAIANLDVGKLTVSSGVISDLVAQHIAARSGAFIQLGVDQLTVTGSAAIRQAVIDKLYADVVKAKLLTVTEKIIANDIFAAGVVSATALAADAIDGKLITGATIRTAASGQRLQLDSTGLRAFNSSGAVTAALSAASGGLDLQGRISSQLSAKYTYGGMLYGGYSTSSLSPGMLQVQFKPDSGAFSVATTLTADSVTTDSVYASTVDAKNDPLWLQGSSIVSFRSPKTLWSGVLYMNSAQTANLSEYVNYQLSGIVLAWSAYADGAAANSSWNYVFVPKTHVVDAAGAGVLQTIYGWKSPVWKYVYIYNNRITGHADNNVAPANTQVLRAVYGV